MSAHAIRPIEQQNEYSVHKIFLSSRNKMSNILRKYYNKGKSDLYEGNKKGNSSSQISTFEENSLYEKQNVPKYALPFKNNHQIENKIYQKINKRLKELKKK